MSLLDECARLYRELERLSQLAPEDILQQLGGDVHQVFDAMWRLEMTSRAVRRDVTPPGWTGVAWIEDVHLVSIEKLDPPPDAPAPPSAPPSEE